MTRTMPSIRVSQHISSEHQHSTAESYNYPSSSLLTTSMAIPRAREAVPPPLPPPQYLPEISLGQDPGWQWSNDASAHDFARNASVKPGSSLLGGSHSRTSSLQEPNDDVHIRRTSSASTITPPLRDVEMSNVQTEEEYRPEGSIHGRQDSMKTDPDGYRLQSERRLERTTFEGSAVAYDKQLLSRIGGPNTPSKLPGSSIDGSERERRNSQLPAIGQSQDSVSRWLPSMSSSGARSPGVHWESSHTRHNSLASEGRYDNHEDFSMDDNQREDPFGGFKIGAKRRASSPPRDLQDRNGTSDLVRRSQATRFHPSHASLSSVSSFGGVRHGSLSSSAGISSIPSSATSYASGVISPLAAASAMDTEPKSAVSDTYQRNTSDFAHIEQKGSNKSHSRHSSRSQPGQFVCECCPKKPKKFDTEEELRSHESEKQYGCMYCTNRFKNKNEAERHQNSLHLRRHSWSCAALAGFEAAFHPSTTGNDADICGYCGESFHNPPDWKTRVAHLNVNHKFGQCNQTKRFYRADHFRQHLKHSHDGASGKWTNMLETACMKDEPPPQVMKQSTTNNRRT